MRVFYISITVRKYFKLYEGLAMKKTVLVLATIVLVSMNVYAGDGYQHGWKVYDNPQAGATYSGVETNPYGDGGSKSYGAGGGNSYGDGGGKNAANPWHVADED